MTLARVRVGDIVEVDGLGHAKVLDVGPGCVRVQPIGRSEAMARTVRARQVVAHWRRTGR